MADMAAAKVVICKMMKVTLDPCLREIPYNNPHNFSILENVVTQSFKITDRLPVNVIIPGACDGRLLLALSCHLHLDLSYLSQVLSTLGLNELQWVSTGGLTPGGCCAQSVEESVGYKEVTLDR